MENRLKHFGPRELATIFDFLATQLNEVVWICSNDYKTQLYTSPLFENCWGFSRNIMYENRDVWVSTLFQEDLKRLNSAFTERQQKNFHPVIAFRIQRPDGQIRFIKDNSFGICDKNGYQVAQLGMAKMLTEMEWDELEQNKFQEKNTSVNNQFNIDLKDILINNLQLDLAPQKIIPLKNSKQAYYIFIDDQAIQLTRGEAKCLFYLMQSLHTKVIASRLNLSPRTIETYIENIKRKAKCSRSIELVNKIKNREQVSNWVFE